MPKMVQQKLDARFKDVAPQSETAVVVALPPGKPPSATKPPEPSFSITSFAVPKALQPGEAVAAQGALPNSMPSHRYAPSWWSAQQTAAKIKLR